MKKQLVVVWLVWIFLIINLSGCMETQNNSEKENDKAYTNNNPISLYCTPSFEREDWETTNTGNVNHIIYGIGMYDDNGKFCWQDGILTLKLFDENSSIVFSNSQSFTENDIEYPKISGITKVSYIYDYEIEGDILNAASYNATYVTIDGIMIYSEGEVVGPY
jgi:hypothetical protein